ncbi:MAG: nuclear transport factor 2 family protein [Thalassobaculum sp.]|uniref:YybH family protein n=1 Tax=Thalassobaculum sp. TaxID=2022740 RepID=UPI0032EEF490
MGGATGTIEPEREVLGMLSAWAAEASAGDLDALMAHYVPDIVSYDAIYALQFRGTEAYRAHWQGCLSACESMRFEIHDPRVAVSGDVAFAHYLAFCGGTGHDGSEHTGWMRATAGCRKIDGRWMIVHEHFSAPFDPISGKALFDLQP